MLAHWKHIHLYSLWPGSNKRNCTNWQKHAILVNRVILSFHEFAELSSGVFMLLQIIIPSFHEFAQQPISGFWVTGNNSSLDSSSSSSSSCTGGWQSRLQAL
jgi:hypothetical protein